MIYRNRKLLDIAHEAPCMLQIHGVCTGDRHPRVPAHSDQLRHGRGVGLRSHDCFAVAGCVQCHAAFTRANLGKVIYNEVWAGAFERYVLWCWTNEKIGVR